MAKKKAAPLTLEQIKEKVGDSKKEIAVELPDSLLEGSVNDLSARIKAFAKEHDVPGPVLVGKAVIQKKDNYKSYRYNFRKGQGEYYFGTHQARVLCVIGYRPYTDEELAGAEGMRVVKALERKAAAKAKAEQKIKQLADLHGITL